MKRRAFTLPELLAVAVVGIALACLLIVATTKARRTAQLNESLNNLKTIGSTMGMYEADFQDFLPTYSWHGGQVPPAQDVSADLVQQARDGTDLSAASAQAMWLMRRISGQSNLWNDTWVPFHFNWWLPLAEYANWSTTNGPVVSPADANRLRWIRNPEAFLAHQSTPAPDPPQFRWLYSSSYVPTMSLFSADRGDAPEHGSIDFAFTPRLFRMTNGSLQEGVLGRRRASEVVFPSQKVLITDRDQRHFGTERLVLHPDARTVSLAGDGAAALRATATYNPGFTVGIPSRSFPSFLNYSPDAWEPAPRLVSGEQVNGSVLVTRGGLQGRDFGGRDIDTSTWR